MGEASKIEWTDHTYNPWWGCVRVSPGCERCYAEAFAKRTGNPVWGVNAPRRFFGDKHWDEPRRWNERAAKAGARARVFCASMADVFEDRAGLEPHRERLWRLIGDTPCLDWLVLTKRPENIARLGDDVLRRCWVGVTAEDQRRADERIPLLLRTPAAVRWVSAEPLLSPVQLWIPTKTWGPRSDGVLGCDHCCNGDRCDELAHRDRRHCPYCRGTGAAVKLDWVVVGSESGPGARPMKLEWARAVVDECIDAGVAVFTKQIANEHDRKGGDPQYWPEGVWPRQFPQVSHG